jgi:hypothetical protein
MVFPHADAEHTIALELLKKMISHDDRSAYPLFIDVRTVVMQLQSIVWTCPNCQTVHYRDDNASKTVLAASSVERRNACGAASSGLVATRSETGRLEAGTEHHV